jgi:hypothetical protein
MATTHRRVFFYLDDGHPESSDYDNNYLLVTQKEQPGLLMRLLDWMMPGWGRAFCAKSAAGNPRKA